MHVFMVKRAREKETLHRRERFERDREMNINDEKKHQNNSHHRQFGQICEVGDCSSTSGESDSSSSLSEEDLRAILSADEDSEAIKARAKVMTESISKAILEGMKGLSVKHRKGSSSSAASAGRGSSKSKSKK